MKHLILFIALAVSAFAQKPVETLSEAEKATFRTALQSSTQTLTDGASIAWNPDNGSLAKVTIAGDRTLATPGGTVLGDFTLEVTQDATGFRNLAFSSDYVFPSGDIAIAREPGAKTVLQMRRMVPPTVHVLSATKSVVKKRYTKVAYFGDSLAMRAGSTIHPTDSQWIDQPYSSSWTSWLEVLMAGRYSPVRNTFATVSADKFYDFSFSGLTAQSLLNGDGTYTSPSNKPVQHLDNSITVADRAKTLVLVVCGTNDVNGGASAATTAANVTAVWDYLISGGYNIAALAMPPGDTSAHNNTVKNANLILKANALSRGIVWIPAPTVFLDSVNNYFSDTYSSNSRIHPNTLGCKVWAECVKYYIDGLIQPEPYTPPAEGSSLWKTAYSHFPGDGPLSAAFDSLDNTAAGATCTPSILNDNEGHWQRFTQSGATNPVGLTTYWGYVNTNVAVTGKNYRVVAKVRCSSGTMASVAALNGFGEVGVMSYRWPGDSSQSAEFGNGSTETSGVAFTGGGTYILVSAPFPGNVGGTKPNINLKFGIIGNGTVDFQCAGIVEVP